MKSNEQKYDEASERNLSNAERKEPKKYRGVSLAAAKLMLGIRSYDTRFDERVQTLTRIGMPNPGFQGAPGTAYPEKPCSPLNGDQK